MSRVLETDRLTRRFGDLVAVDGLTLSVEEGAVFGLLGFALAVPVAIGGWIYPRIVT